MSILLTNAFCHSLCPIIAVQPNGVDCAAIYCAGVRRSGVYEISPDGIHKFNVYCDMRDGKEKLITIYVF